MTKSLKLFLFLRESYQKIGFYPSQSGNIPFNWKNAFILLSIFQLFLSTSAFFLFEANLLFEYGTSFYAAITTLVSLVVLVIKLLKIADIFTLIKKFDEFIGKRAHNAIAMAMYNEFNTNIERLSKIVHVLLVQILFPAAMVSPLILTLVNYFIFDLKDESFYLPFPVMMSFDWKTPFGYMFALLVQATAFYCTVLGCGPLMCFLIGPGEMTSKHYDKVDQQLFECHWYKFPIEVQRMLVIVTANIQQPVTIHGYGNILCTRDTLNKTTKCGFSYFMMMRHIDG